MGKKVKSTYSPPLYTLILYIFLNPEAFVSALTYVPFMATMFSYWLFVMLLFPYVKTSMHH